MKKRRVIAHSLTQEKADAMAKVKKNMGHKGVQVKYNKGKKRYHISVFG